VTVGNSKCYQKKKKKKILCIKVTLETLISYIASQNFTMKKKWPRLLYIYIPGVQRTSIHIPGVQRTSIVVYIYIPGVQRTSIVVYIYTWSTED